MSNTLVANVSGFVSYTDGTKDTFGVNLDEHGVLVPAGNVSAMADAWTFLKSLFVALGGTLTGTLTPSSKVVNDCECRLSMRGTVGDTKYDAGSNYDVKSGNVIGLNADADYAALIDAFPNVMSDMLTAYAGVTITAA
jgi:hypothetical protein